MPKDGFARAGAAAPEPDLRSHWIGCSYELVDAVRSYLNASGIEYDAKSLVDEVVKFMRNLLSYQLDELGLELRLIEVTNGWDSARRVYLLKPGQEAIIE